MLTCPLLRGGREAARPETRRLSPRFRPAGDALESRELLSLTGLSSVEPSADEQYMLELVNRARANPAAEAQRLLSLAQTDPVLKPALAGWSAAPFLSLMNSAGSLPPLAFNPRLIAAAREHDAAMVAANAQFHTDLNTLVNPSSANQKAPDGQPYFPVASSWSAAENVFAFSANLPDAHGKPLVDYFHEAFLLDWGNPDFGHLKNLLLPGPSGASAAGTYPMTEIGIGIITDTNPTTAPTASPTIAANRGLNVGPALVTQDFGWRSGHQFLEGAVFADRNGDNFYTPGEGLGGVTITAVGLHKEGTYSVQTWGSGGYSLDLPSGTYQVTASGGGLDSPRTTTVAIGQDNVAWDVAMAAVSGSSTTPSASTPASTTISAPPSPGAASPASRGAGTPHANAAEPPASVKIRRRQRRLAHHRVHAKWHRQAS